MDGSGGGEDFAGAGGLVAPVIVKMVAAFFALLIPICIHIPLLYMVLRMSMLWSIYISARFALCLQRTIKQREKFGQLDYKMLS